jgi:hypothetical protein
MPVSLEEAAAIVPALARGPVVTLNYDRVLGGRLRNASSGCAWIS